MKKALSVLVAVALTVGSAQALLAAEVGAGCGIGKMVMEGKKGKGAHITAAILNDILLPKTLFMSTASTIGEPVLGCDPNATVQREAETTYYVALNVDHLSQDVAQGGGTHLEALADAMGIASEDRASFYTMAQDEYATLFLARADAADLMVSLRSAMAERPDLAQYVR